MEPEHPNDEAHGEAHSDAPGMRREWNFTLTVRHEAAKALIQYLPHWTTQFIDPDRIPDLNKMDRDVKHCPMMPFLDYADTTPALHWEELQKTVKILYSHIPPNMTLKQYCKRSVQYVVSDPRVTQVDGFTDLKQLKVMQKMNCGRKLGGMASFQFKYTFVDKSDLRNDSMYAIGTISGQRGYLILIGCARETELDAYVSKMFLPHFCNPKKVILDAPNVKYDESTYNALTEQLERYGELLYVDKDACVSFSIPMHSMRVRPDFSPTQTVGVGSIACMTLEVDIYQKLVDEGVEAEITGMPKYRVNNAVLFLDVEDVARMGYPSIMSIEQYSQEKVKRLFDTFADATLVGTPITLTMGKRAGRSQCVTFTYDAMQGVVKGMLVSTLVGNSGVTALYFIKLGQGLFDAHLYLFQQLLKTISFSVERPQAKEFSRFNAVNIRLTDQDLPRSYTTAPVNDRRAMERHLKSLQYSNDGKVDGATVVSCQANTEKKPPTPQVGLSLTGAVITKPTLEIMAALDSSSVVVESDSVTYPDDMSVISVTSIEHLHIQNAWDVETWEEEAAPISTPQKSAVDNSNIVNTNAVPIAALGVQKSEDILSVEDGADSSDGSVDHNNNDAANTQQDIPSPTSEKNNSAPTSTTNAAAHEQQEKMKLFVEQVIKADEDVYFGPSLRDVYARCCDIQRCRPNSYLMRKLPDNPRFKTSIEELDMSSNYLGHSGFVAVLNLIEHLPQLRTVYFNDMALDNTDVSALTEILSKNSSVHGVFLRNNVKITLPAIKDFTRLLRTNKRITELSLEGTRIGESLITKLEAEAKANKVEA